MGAFKNICYRLFGCCMPNYDVYNQFDDRDGVRKKKKLLYRE